MIVTSSFIYFRCYSAVSTIRRTGADITGVLITIRDHRNVSSFARIMARLIALKRLPGVLPAVYKDMCQEINISVSLCMVDSYVAIKRIKW